MLLPQANQSPVDGPCKRHSNTKMTSRSHVKFRAKPPPPSSSPTIICICNKTLASLIKHQMHSSCFYYIIILISLILISLVNSPSSTFFVDCFSLNQPQSDGSASTSQTRQTANMINNNNNNIAHRQPSSGQQPHQNPTTSPSNEYEKQNFRHYVKLASSNSSSLSTRPKNNQKSILGQMSDLHSSQHPRPHHHHQQPSQFTSNNQEFNPFQNVTLDSRNVLTDSRTIKTNEKICIGTSNRMSGQHNKTDHYQNLVERYKNCTYVIGNLEITWLERTVDGKPTDLSFLENIREITGYLLIGYVDVKKIRMPNLQIIRGRDTFKLNKPDQKDEFAMFLIENELETLELPNLREIIYGSVGFFDNRNLYFMRTIVWDEILNAGFKTLYLYNSTTEPESPQCDRSCQNGCWAEGPDMCQKFSKTTCAQQCSQGRCFGSEPRECCHLFCAGGCTGPKQTDCFACKHFDDNGECVQECPSMQKYNPNKFVWESDPNGKYAFGATCVKQCPEHLLRDNGACVRTCPPNKRSNNGECEACSGPCPKNCQGVDIVHSGNIDQFINCTSIEGSLTILDTTFTGYSEVYNNNAMGPRYEPMHPSRLNVFKTIKTITGYLSIQASHPDFRDLSCFKNLTTIGGRQMMELEYSLAIIKTSLVSLGLTSLSKIRVGKVRIEENKDLCFTDTMNWIEANMTRPDLITVRNNADHNNCRERGLYCHDQCTKQGCWGPSQDECLSCKNFRLDDYCVDNCTVTQPIGLSYQASDRTCERCHSECKYGCKGPGSNDCRACKSVRDGPYCVSKCPVSKYNDHGICEECDKSCSEGCSGPSNKLGEGGCNSCQKIVVNTTSIPHQVYCLKETDKCPEGYYPEYMGPQREGMFKSSVGKPVCRKCHDRCKSCTGMGTHIDVCTCASYIMGEQCEDSCSRDHYADHRSNRCIKCHHECNGCFGPTEADCHSCRVFRVYTDSMMPIAQRLVIDRSTSPNNNQSLSQLPRFNCSSQCPSDKPHRVSDSNSMLDPYCSEDPGPDIDNSKLFAMGSMYVMVPIIMVALVVCFVVYRKQDKHKTVTKLTMRLSGFEDDVEPLNQSNLKPNLAPLRSIKETELRKGKIMGSGFGGTVYLGMWYPEGREHKEKPVAIKVLRDNGQANKNKEFLDEAYMMASVNHPNLVKLLAVCMTPDQLMLVTPLMACGCLLDYVKKHKNELGSKNLLEWCKQVAKGMAYLEDRRMVHRDLALRNVLVSTCGRAVISDFGLAKFLDVDQSEYHSGGGRLPIKWLAPECIRERKFTHKSDVWAFGVTVWELLTFGSKPFEEVETKDVPMEIVKGARLPKPGYISVEVYKVMYSCWFYHPDERPDFKGLLQSFINFARDPERYIDMATKGIVYNTRREIGQNSDSDENCFEESGSEMNSMLDEELSNQAQPIIPDLMSIRPDSNFVPNMRKHSESDSGPQNIALMMQANKKIPIVYDSRQQLIEEELSFNNLSRGDSKTSTNHLSDLNNNFMTNNRSNHTEGLWSSLQTMSTCSIGRTSEQPTDEDDYLKPSPISHKDKFTKILASQERMIKDKLAPGSSFARDPPHSAGLIGISNEEYFMTQVNYANHSGPHSSTNHIPNSLV